MVASTTRSPSDSFSLNVEERFGRIVSVTAMT